MTEVPQAGAPGSPGVGGAWGSAPAAPRRCTSASRTPFAPARKARPALVVDDVAALDALAARLSGLGFAVDERGAGPSFPGFQRFHTFDGHGNRVEVLGHSARVTRR